MTEDWTMPEQENYTATCVTAACENENIGIPIVVNVDITPKVECGPCGQTITNITAA